jgi:NitT/TauT family transport system permease protein
MSVDEIVEIKRSPTRTRPPHWKIVFYKHRQWILGITGFVVVVAVWELICDTGLVGPLFLTPPSQIATGGYDYLKTPSAWNDLKVSGETFAVGYGASIAFGIPMGLLMGWYRVLRELLDPLVTFAYSMPHVALMPLLIIWLGIGTLPRAALIFLMCAFTILVNTVSGVKGIDRTLINVARSFSASDWKIFRTIVLPGSVPSIIAGLRLGVGRGVIGVVVAELVASTAGVGHYIAIAGAVFETTQVFVGIVLIALFGVLFTLLLQLVERHFDKWRP